MGMPSHPDTHTHIQDPTPQNTHTQNNTHSQTHTTTQSHTASQSHTNTQSHTHPNTHTQGQSQSQRQLPEVVECSTLARSPLNGGPGGPGTAGSKLSEDLTKLRQVHFLLSFHLFSVVLRTVCLFLSFLFMLPFPFLSVPFTSSLPFLSSPTFS